MALSLNKPKLDNLSTYRNSLIHECVTGQRRIIETVEKKWSFCKAGKDGIRLWSRARSHRFDQGAASGHCDPSEIHGWLWGMKGKLLADTGALLCLLAESSEHHVWAANAVREFTGPAHAETKKSSRADVSEAHRRLPNP